MDSLRLSDADRESAMDLLSEHYAIGRLTKDEFDERSDAVWSAKTQGDLAPVFVDLPVRSQALATPMRGRRSRRGFPVPIVPILIVLIAFTVVTHLPFVLIAVGLWFFLGRWHWRAVWGPGPRHPASRG